MTDYGEKNETTPNFHAITQDEKTIAIAVTEGSKDSPTPKITAAARGALAEKIIQIAFENDIKVRKDTDLAEMLATIELDSPIPSEALMAVAEILSYVYRANGEPNPFDALLSELDDDNNNTEDLFNDV